VFFMGFADFDYKESGDGVWRTINGRAVFIKRGQTLRDALKRVGVTGGRADRAEALHRERRKADRRRKQAQRKVEDKMLDEMFAPDRRKGERRRESKKDWMKRQPKPQYLVPKR